MKLFEKQPLSVHLQLINVWSQPISRWLPQSDDVRKHNTGHDSAKFTDIELKFTADVLTVLTNISWTICILINFDKLIFI